MKERVHRLIAPAGSLSIEPCNPLARVLTFGELRFGVRDAFSSFAELPERLLAAVTVLVTSRGRTCNEDVCADVQRSNVSSGWRRSALVTHRHWLMSSVRIDDIVVGEREVPLFPVPLRISSNQDAWLLVWSESVFVC